MKRTKSRPRTNARNKLRSRPAASRTSPFIEHVYELRKRLFYVAASIIIFGIAAYGVQQHIVNALLRPAKNQQFIYTTPGGGIDFLFRVCLYVGIAASIPVIIFHILKFLEPLIKRDAARFIAWGSVASGVLAAAGMAFGYFVGLPAALHFLLHQFTNHQIQALLSIQSYMSFVMVYLLGSALLFQLPLILLFINRIKPLQPRKLLRYERWVIAIAVILGGILNPTPNIIDQAMLAGPMILTYQIGIVLVLLTNRSRRQPKQVEQLRAQDITAQSARLERRKAATPILQSVPMAAAAPVQPSVARAQPAPSAAHRSPARQRYINDFYPRRSYLNPAQGIQPE